MYHKPFCLPLIFIIIITVVIITTIIINYNHIVDKIKVLTKITKFTVLFVKELKGIMIIIKLVAVFIIIITKELFINLSVMIFVKHALIIKFDFIIMEQIRIKYSIISWVIH